MNRILNRTEYEAVDAWAELAVTQIMAGKIRVPDTFVYDVNDGVNDVVVERIGRSRDKTESYWVLTSTGWKMSFTERGGETGDDPLTFHNIFIQEDESFQRAVLMRQLCTNVAV